VPAGSFDGQIPNHIIQKRLKTLLALGQSEYEIFSQKNDEKELQLLVEKTTPANGTTKFS
jgi:tRNA A37 methylthiotransferase MiaB